jgi:hypothetical protein
MYVLIGGRNTLLMVLDTGSPAPAISPRIAQLLQADRVLPASETLGRYWLAAIRARDAAGYPILPSLMVRILPRLARLQIDGLLGLDFFRQFDRVCFQLSAMRLELTYPGA